MQTRKKASGRNTKVIVNPKKTKPQKKISEVGPQKKVTDFITSSARKQKADGPPVKKNDSNENLESRFGSIDEDVSTVCLEQYNKGYDDESDTQEMETIFSPTFHLSGNGEVISEDSEIYENSKLECVDDVAADVEDEEFEEFDDFDPFVFIKNLPHLSTIVPAFRPVLLPKRTRSCPNVTLVLDLDETLVHSSLEPCTDADFTFPVHFNQEKHIVYVKCRPYLKEFMEKASSLFEIIIFTASQSIYAEQLLNVLDPKRKIFRHRVFRESCVYFDGNYLKDLTVLGRDLSKIMIVDNSPQAFGFQVDNGIPIESWFDDRSDKELFLLLPFLETLAVADDVRPLIAQKFNLKQKIFQLGR